MNSDLRSALRSLIKRPGFSLVVIATLALGIGASTAIFSVLDAVLLRPLPYPQQERIVELLELDGNGKGMRFAEPNVRDLKSRSRSFAALAQYAVWPEAVAGGSEPVRVDACSASAEFFNVLGVKPLIGRLFSTEARGEEKEVVVVSYAFWKKLLQSRSNLDGAALRFANHSFSVIGVLPPEVEFPPKVEIWFPSELNPPNESRTAHNWRVAARLRDGVSLVQARSEIAGIGQQLKQEHGNQIDAFSFGLTPLRERFVKDVRGTLFVICGAVVLLLLIACSNVANLLLVRATARRKEIALRAALGASRARLARQFILESVLLTLAAGVLGVFLALLGVGLIVRLYHGNLPRLGEVSVNSTVLLFTLGVSLLVGVTLGFVPALHAFGRQLQGDLQEAGRGQSAGLSHTRVRNFLIVSQVALTLILLVGAGLLGQSFQRLLEVRPGFEPESAVAMTVSLPYPEEPTAARNLAQFYHQLLERLSVLPGVTAVGGTSALPMMGNGGNGTFVVEAGGKSAETMAALEQEMHALAGSGRTGDAEFRVASSGYFGAMGIPLLRGRLFQESDGAESQHVALISQTMARRYWPNEESIGKQIQFGNMDGDLRLLNVIGVVGDIRDDGLDAEARPMVYVNYFQRPAAAGEFSIVLRGHGDAAGLTSAMRREARALNPEMPTKFETLEQIVAASLDNRRFSMVMLGVFAGAALVLAMVGLYGVMSYITSQRTTEIGIRMALGAQRSDMLRLILQQCAILVSIGVGAGIAAAAGATKVLRSLLYGIGAADLMTYLGVVLLLALAALIASYIPARRAMRIDPMVALRHE